jgi:hypothetical protein
VWVGAVSLLVHVEPVFIPTPVTPLYAFIGFVGDVVWLSFVFERHGRVAGMVIEKGSNAEGGFRSSESVKYFLLHIHNFALFFKKVTSFLDQFPFSFCQFSFPLYEVAKLTIELDQL